LYGGWIPVIVGMFLLGCGVRLLDDVLDVRANPHAIFLVLLIFPSLVKGEDDWESLLASVPATLFIWLLATALTFRARRRA
jgi:threonine/homoserine/homoserine lactone efflux protein